MTQRTPATLRDGIPLPFDCKPLRVRGMKDGGKPFTPKPRAVGAEIVLTRPGGSFYGQVWAAAANGCVWAAADGVVYLVSKSGDVLEVNDYRRAGVAA